LSGTTFTKTDRIVSEWVGLGNGRAIQWLLLAPAIIDVTLIGYRTGIGLAAYWALPGDGFLVKRFHGQQFIRNRPRCLA
jgi:hypothetical protein